MPLSGGSDMADAACLPEVGKMIFDASKGDSYAICQGFAGDFRVFAQ